uniref:Uncharacterized protein n=1 Tax=viral metagenome TaxID=1070528 RepID=A0A6C0D3W6_9ZZZZ
MITDLVKENIYYTGKVFGIYILWILIHYVCVYLYLYFCTPSTITGFFMSPFLVPAIHCQAFRWAIYNGGNSIYAMWFILGAWIVKYITPLHFIDNRN